MSQHKRFNKYKHQRQVSETALRYACVLVYHNSEQITLDIMNGTGWINGDPEYSLIKMGLIPKPDGYVPKGPDNKLRFKGLVCK